ncbi:MAG: Gfo/Idh/MocA family oxidoreductase [Lentisphaeria bacterium]
MEKEITVALTAINGYGRGYLNEMLDHATDKNVRLVGIIDPTAKLSDRFSELESLGVPCFSTLEEFYAKHNADLVVISAPIQFHVPFSKLALAHGSNVLCEKPLTATIQDGLDLANAEENAKGFAAIGYQHSFAAVTQKLKQDIIAGKFGRPIQFKNIVLWPRNQKYYTRNNWAGCQKNAKGDWVLDSPVNNANAHHLHNMLYLLGKTSNTAIKPLQIQAELYRANPITNYDTAALRCKTEDDVDILFYVSHAVSFTLGPIINYKFEKATIIGELDGHYFVRYNDGHMEDYGAMNYTHGNKLWQCVHAVRTKGIVPCDVHTALSQTICMNGAQDSCPEIISFPKEIMESTGEGSEKLYVVKELTNILSLCFSQGMLPSELGCCPWAKPGKIINLKNYHEFHGSACVKN